MCVTISVKRQFNQIVESNRIIFSPNRNALVIRDHTTQTSGLRRSRVKNGAVYGHTSSIVLHHIPTNWRRPAGRPRQTWLATITNDLDQLGISMDDVCEQAADRALWRRLIHGATHDDDDDVDENKVDHIAMLSFCLKRFNDYN